jgi:hypothetical protein
MKKATRSKVKKDMNKVLLRIRGTVKLFIFFLNEDFPRMTDVQLETIEVLKKISLISYTSVVSNPRYLRSQILHANYLLQKHFWWEISRALVTVLRRLDGHLGREITRHELFGLLK